MMEEHPADKSDASVIVCTIGRLEPLKASLQALRNQTLSPLELIVVLGPAARAAEEFLAAQRDVKLVRIDQRNISAARNVGVQLAAGKIVAFCDDDAVAEPDWLAHLVEAFEDAAVGGCGGKALDGWAETTAVSFENGIVRLSGRQRHIRDAPGEYNDPRGPWYNHVIGCNCAFRREALLEIGRFDDFIEFAYEETDVCLRLIYAGYRIVHVPGAVVIHTSCSGRERQLMRNWYAEIKNQLYFGLKNRRGIITAARTILRVLARLVQLKLRMGAAVWRKKIRPEQAMRFYRDLMLGFWRGLRAGLTKRARR